MVGTEVAVESANREVAQSNVIFGRFGKGAAGQIGNVSNQLADLAIVAGSGNASVGALSVQVGQAAAGFGPWGAAIGAAITILGGLSTVLLRTKGDAVSTTDALSGFETSMGALKDAVSLATTPLAQLQERFAGTRAEIKALIAAQVDLASLDAEIARVQLLNSVLGEFIDTTERSGRNQSRAFAGLNEGVRSLVLDLGLARDEATALQAALLDADNAAGYEAQADAIGEAVRLLKAATSAEDDRSEAASETLRSLISTEAALREAAALQTTLERGALGVADAFRNVRVSVEGTVAATRTLGDEIRRRRTELDALRRNMSEEEAADYVTVAEERRKLQALLDTPGDVTIQQETQARIDLLDSELKTLRELKAERETVLKGQSGPLPRDLASDTASTGGGAASGGASLREVNRDVEDAQRVIELVPA